MEYLYKYRSLSNMKRFIDILMNRRLYASKYLDLNDPMEGFFLYDKKAPRSVVSKLWDERAKTLICSLSKTPFNGVKSVQWQHEEEVRYINPNSKSPYLKIEIDTIFFGAKMSRADVSFYTELINMANKAYPKKKPIKVEKLTKDDIDFGF